MFITVNETDYELSTTLRTAQKICNKYKKTTEQLLTQLGEGLPAELLDILKSGLADPAQAADFESAVLDGGYGVSQLRNAAAAYLLELTYPGTADEKAAAVDATKGADEEAKNGLRALLGLPLKPLAPGDSGSN